jgi:hypothetical protein
MTKKDFELLHDKDLLQKYISAMRALSGIEEELLKRAKEEFETRETMKEDADTSKSFYFSKERTEQALKEFLHKVTKREWNVTPHTSYYFRQANGEGVGDKKYVHTYSGQEIVDKYERKTIDGESYLVRKPEFWEYNP